MSEKPTEPDPPSWLADDPLASSGSMEDRLDRGPFVAAVAGVMRRAYRPGGSSVFGLIGRWGSGKTSIISMLRRELTAGNAQHPPWSLATFNPWGYGDQLSLQWGFFAELRSAMPKGKAWKDAKKTLDTLKRFTTPAAAAAALAHPGAGEVVSAAVGFFETSPTKAREAAEAALRALNEPILVVIDDLDRLSSSELLEVFKLVRFTGRLPNVYYLLSYDEQTLLELLAKTDLVGSTNDGRALDYLEKIVQVRFDVPPLLPELVQREFNDGLTAILASLQLAVDDQDTNRLTHFFRDAFRLRLDTPRAIKRYLGQIEAFLPPVANEVDWVDFVALSWIRTFEPVLYGLLQPHKDLLLGSIMSYVLNQSAKTDERKAAVDALLAAAQLGPANESQTVVLLGELFPVVKNTAGRGQYSEQSAQRGRINNPDYFDRFFQFGVPADDISDASVSQALRDVSVNETSASLNLLEQQLAHATDRTLRKLRSESGRAGVDNEAVARWIASRYDTIDQNDGTFFNPQTNVEVYFGDLLLTLPLERAKLVVDEVAVDLATATLVTTAVAVLARMQFGGVDEIAEANALGQALTEGAASVARSVVERSASEAPTVFDISADCWRLIWRWDDLKPADVREFFDVKVRDGVWSALDLLSRLVAASIPMGVTNPVGRLSGVNEELARHILDLDDLTAKLDDQLSDVGSIPADRALLDTPDNRRTYALAWLRARRERESS